MSENQPSRFPTTNWSIILESASPSPAAAEEAMSRLCSRYWLPIFKFILGKCRDFHQAEDLTQGFFEFVIRHGVIQRARRERGRFRNFMAASIQHFLHNQHDHATAAKRGGNHPIDRLDTACLESIPSPPDLFSGDRSFDREWALALAARTMEALAEDYLRRDSKSVHDALVPFLTRSATGADYEAAGAALGISRGAAEQACRTMRARFGAILRREISQTVFHPDEIEGEIRHLLSILAEN